MSRFVYQTPQGESNTVEFEWKNGQLHLGEQSLPCDGQSVWLDGRRVPFAVSKAQDKVRVWLDGEVYQFTVRDPRQRAATGAEAGLSSGRVSAQMPGKILSMGVKVGDKVNVGQNLLIMESMKMELALNASIDGVVKSVRVTVGQMVAQGDLLVELQAPE